MHKTYRNPWFLLACCFLIINTYGVLRVTCARSGTNHHPTAEPAAPDPLPRQEQPITWRQLQQVDQDDEGRIILALEFDRHVSPAVLQRFLAVADGDGAPIEPHIPDQPASQRLAVAIDASPRATINVTIRKGLYAEYGKQTLEMDITRGILLQPGIALTRLSPQSPPFSAPRIQLSFSLPVNVASLRNAISFEPAVDVIVTEESHWYRGRTYSVAGAFTPGRNYTLRIHTGLRAESGNRRLLEDIEQVFFLPDTQAAIRIPQEGRFLSSYGNRMLTLERVNVKAFTIEAARLPAQNLVQYAMREGRHYTGFWSQPANQITIPEVEQIFTLDAPANSNILHQISLRDLLPQETGAGTWQIRIRHGDNQRADDRLLVISDIGITVRHAAREMLVWANAIHSLDPLAGAQVKIWSAQAELLLEGETDSQGIAILPLTGSKLEPFLITVQHGSDLSFISLPDTRLPEAAAQTSRRYLSDDDLEAFVYPDRGVYRPGETTHIRAILRGPRMLLPAPMPIVLHAIRPDGREHSRTHGMLGPYGTAEFQLPWNDFDATGRYRLELRTPGADEALGQTRISIEDFVPPRMAVNLTLQAETNRPAGSSHIAARYLYGAPAAQSRFDLSLHVIARDFAPPQFPDHAIGNPERTMPPKIHPIGKGNLNQHGETTLGFTLPDDLRPPAMIDAIVTATVHEQGGRTVSTAARSPMHVYPYYIGIHKPDLRNVPAGRPAIVNLQLVSQDGSAFAASLPLTVTLHELRWSTVLTRDTQGRYRFTSERQLTPRQSKVIKTDAQGTASYTFNGYRAGQHLLLVESDEGVSSSCTFAIGSGSWQERAMDHPDHVDLQWDRETYLPGDTATLSVTAPFAGRALLTIEQDHLLFRDSKLMEGNHTVFMVPVTQAMRPNAHASVHVIRALPPGDAHGRQSVRATGTLPLLINDKDQRLLVDISAPDTSLPKSPMPVTIQVRNPDGSPAKAEIAIAAIDEAICMLTDFRTPDPIRFFAGLRRNGFRASDLYAMLMPESDPESIRYQAHTGGDVASLLRGRLNPVRSRRFKPLALWQGSIETDAQGHASLEFDIPEFSGQIRLMAVAVTPARMGSGEKRVVINRPLTVLASLPRFLAPRDRTRMPIELHYTGADPTKVTLQVAVTGNASFAGTNTFSFMLTPDARQTLDIPIQAGTAPGLAQFTITATTADRQIVDTIELPVRPATPYQTRHTHLVLDPGAAYNQPARTNWFPGTTRATLRVSRLPDTGMTGALAYLMRYPYGCLEQTVSAALPLLTLREHPLWYQDETIITDPDAQLTLLLNRILAMQTADGGFGWWPHATEPYRWGSVYAMDLLIDAHDAGLGIPQYAIDNGLQYLQRLLAQAMPNRMSDPHDWQESAGLRAYICYIMAKAGKPRHDWNARLREQAEWMDIDSRLHLVLSLIAAKRHRDARALLETNDDAPSQPAYADGGSLITPARTAALSLLAWLRIDPQSHRVPDLLRALIAHKRNGRWRTTQENAAAFRALAYHKALLDGHETTFTAILDQPECEPQAISEHSPALMIAPMQAIAITNNGPGILYASIEEHGIPANRSADADHGIRIRRQYRDLQQHPIDDESIPQGTLMIVELEIDTRNRRIDNLVIEDLLPAGLEIENANLKTTELVAWAKQQSNMPLRQTEIRDDRIILFTEAISGIRRYYYAARAVTPGTYTRPPVSVEGMYNPERRSTHHGGTLIIE